MSLVEPVDSDSDRELPEAGSSAPVCGSSCATRRPPIARRRCSAPLQPFRRGRVVLRSRSRATAAAPSPERVARLLDGSTASGSRGTIELVALAAAAVAASSARRPPLAESWAAALATLPADWSDLLGEIELDSSDYLERAALLCAAQSAPRRRARGAAFRGARQLRLRRLAARWCAAASSAATPSGSAARSRPARALGHPSRRTQGPVWQIGGRRSDERSRQLAADRARLEGRRLRRRHLGQVELIARRPMPTSSVGIEISISLLKAAKYIPSEHIGEIVEGEVHLGLTADEARTLEFREPGTPSGRP